MHPLQVRGKAMAGKAGDMLGIARDILLTARLDDRERFKQVLVVYCVVYQSSI